MSEQELHPDTSPNPTQRPVLRLLMMITLCALALFALRTVWLSQNPRGFFARGFVTKTHEDLQILAMALREYQSTNGHFPPLVTFDPGSITAPHQSVQTVELTALGLSPERRDKIYGGDETRYEGPQDLHDWGTARSSSSLMTALPYRVHLRGEDFLLISAGIDGDYDIDPTLAEHTSAEGFVADSLHALGTYDSTNGANSSGDIWKASRAPWR